MPAHSDKISPPLRGQQYFPGLSMQDPAGCSNGQEVLNIKLSRFFSAVVLMKISPSCERYMYLGMETDII